MSLLPTSFPSIHIFNFNEVAPVTLNSNWNNRPITYPINASSLTYGLDLLIETWEEQKYMPCNTYLGKIFDYITGWTKDENGNSNPSIIGRIANLFSKSKEIIKKESNENKALSTSEGKIVDYEINSNSNVTGTFQVTYMQNGCSSVSSINGNWEMILEVDVPESIDNFESTFYNSLENCLVNPMLEDYFQRVAYFCDITTVCGCPEDEPLFSFTYQYKQSSLKIFNSDTLPSTMLLPYQNYPAPNLELINYCYDDAINQATEKQRGRSVFIASVLYIGFTSTLFGCTLFCIFTSRCKKKSSKTTVITENEEKVNLIA